VNTKYGREDDHVLFIASALPHVEAVRSHTELQAGCRSRRARSLAGSGLRADIDERTLPVPAILPCCRPRSLAGFRRLRRATAREVAFEVNERTENIGARRLHTSWSASWSRVLRRSDRSGTHVLIDRAYVEGNLASCRATGPVAYICSPRRPSCATAGIKLRTASRVLE